MINHIKLSSKYIVKLRFSPDNRKFWK